MDVSAKLCYDHIHSMGGDAMENIIAKRARQVTLTKTQQKIADYFIRNPERVGMSSSMEVAREIGVSDASIIRFARAIGYERFSDLKNDIYTSMAQQATGGINSLSLTERLEIHRAKYGDTEAKATYLKMLQFNLERTFQENTDDAFSKAVDMLQRAGHHYVIGFRGCKGVASQFAWLMRILLDHVIYIGDEGTGGVGSLQDIQASDCAFFFSVSRYYKSDLCLAQLARKRGAQICVITDSVLSPLADLADVVLLAETRRISFFQSMSAMNMIAEYILSLLVRKNEEVYHRKAEERDELTKDMRL